MIESVNNERVKYWAKLQNKKYQDAEEKFIIEGEHLVEEAQKSGNLLEAIILKGNDFDYENKTFVTEDVMKKITSLTNVPKIIGISSKITPKNIEGTVLLLDRVSNPGNMGTIIRSAVAFGIQTIVLSEGCVSIYNPKVVRATEGLLFHINIVERDLKDAILELKNRDYKIYSTNVEHGRPLKNTKFGEKTAIIMGSEGSGVDAEIENLSDELLYIPMSETCESLNVGVATSIILYELYNR